MSASSACAAGNPGLAFETHHLRCSGPCTRKRSVYVGLWQMYGEVGKVRKKINEGRRVFLCLGTAQSTLFYLLALKGNEQEREISMCAHM